MLFTGECLSGLLPRTGTPDDRRTVWNYVYARGCVTDAPGGTLVGSRSRLSASEGRKKNRGREQCGKRQDGGRGGVHLTSSWLERAWSCTRSHCVYISAIPPLAVVWLYPAGRGKKIADRGLRFLPLSQYVLVSVFYRSGRQRRGAAQTCRYVGGRLRCNCYAAILGAVIHA